MIVRMILYAHAIVCDDRMRIRLIGFISWAIHGASQCSHRGTVRHIHWFSPSSNRPCAPRLRAPRLPSHVRAQSKWWPIKRRFTYGQP
jgi:hypothetical protein